MNLKRYSDEGHEIIIIDDGSWDNSYKILSESKFIKLLHLKKTKEKEPIRFGLKESINPMIVIYDGDLELNPLEIQKLMKLNKIIKSDLFSDQDLIKYILIHFGILAILFLRFF